MGRRGLEVEVGGRVVPPLGTSRRSCDTQKSGNAQPARLSGDVPVFSRFDYQDIGEEILGTKALKFCGKTPLPHKEVVDIWQTSQQRGEAYHYGGLMHCGSVWVCTVCSPRISAKRQKELQEALERWTSDGHGVQMLTLTVPHYAHQRLEPNMVGINKALRKMLDKDSWERVEKPMGIVGRIRALEVTYGDANGWHPHFHILLFTKKTLAYRQMTKARTDILKLWQLACKSAGLAEPSAKHGVDLSNGQKAGKYIAKWGLSHELTKREQKEGKIEGHITPFGLLDRYAAGDENAAKLFREYAKCFKGRRQLVYSDGLRRLLGMGKEKTDPELMEEEDEKAIKFLSIDRATWKIIVKHKKRGQVLKMCEVSKDAALDFIMNLLDSLGLIEEV
jgi:hypothetical protein